jgi:all-trans-retinol 13,14-reductase
MDTGAPPDRASFVLGACVARGLAIEGGAYPVGGSGELAKCLIPVIAAAGGRVLVRANVREISVDARSGQTTGVEMDDGTHIPSRQVVSSTGYHNTFGKLVPDDVTKRLEIPRRLPIRSSCGFVMANIGLRGSPEELGLTCANLWFHPTREDGDMFGAVADFLRDPQDPDNDPMIMVTFPSIKDRSAAGRDKTTCQLLCLAEYDWFEKYAGRRTRRRGAEYKALKAEWGERLVEVLLRFYPQLKDRIELVDVSTPLSIEHYLGSDRGGAVGLDHTPERFTDWEIVKRLDPRTDIPGLWLTGQDTVTCGQPIVQGAGLITALRVLGPLKAAGFLAKAAPPVVRQVLRDLRAARREPSGQAVAQ